MKKVQRLYEQKNYGQAFEQAQTLGKGKQACVLIAKILSAMNQPDIAQSYFLMATETEGQKSQIMEGLIERGKLSYKLERYKEARKIFEQVYQMDNNNTEVNQYLGRLLETDGELGKSRQYYQACLRLNPRNSRYQLLMRNVERKIEREEAMEKTSVQALKAKILHLEQKIQRIKKEPQNLCVACYDGQASFANKECGHCTLCNLCVEKIKQKKCPICKRRGQFIKICRI